MSTTMTLPAPSWVSAHRALTAALAVALVVALAMAIALLVVPAIGTAQPGSPTLIPRINTGEGSCHSVLPGLPC